MRGRWHSLDLGRWHCWPWINFVLSLNSTIFLLSCSAPIRFLWYLNSSLTMTNAKPLLIFSVSRFNSAILSSKFSMTAIKEKFTLKTDWFCLIFVCFDLSSYPFASPTARIHTCLRRVPLKQIAVDIHDTAHRERCTQMIQRSGRHSSTCYRARFQDDSDVLCVPQPTTTGNLDPSYLRCHTWQQLNGSGKFYCVWLFHSRKDSIEWVK